MQNAMDEFDHARFTEGLFDENLQDIWIEFESEIDTLYNKVANYRKSDKFRQIVNFCTNFQPNAATMEPTKMNDKPSPMLWEELKMP